MTEKIIVVDLDDTLFTRSLLTKLLFRLSRILFKLGIHLELLNPKVANILLNYERKIVLTARANDWMKHATLQQLKQYGINVDKVILCPRDRLYKKWKRRMIAELRKEHPNLVWLDTDFNETQ